MTELDLTPIKDRLARAHTEWGEWIVESDEWGVCHSVIIQDDGPGYSVIAEGVIQGEDDGLADAIFIAAASTDIAALLAEVERLRAQVQREAAEPHLRKKWAEEVRALSIGDPGNIEDCLRHEPEVCDLCRGREQAAKLLEGPGNE